MGGYGNAKQVPGPQVRVVHKAEAMVSGGTLTKGTLLAILDNESIPPEAVLTFKEHEGQRGGTEAITVTAQW